MPLEPFSPPGIAPPAATYSHAVVVTDATRWLHTSGMVATRADGTVPDGIAEQAEQVWENLAVVVAEAGMTMADVVSVVTFVVHGYDLAAVMAARDRAMAGHRPASTLIPVPALARPAWLMEVALVCAR